MKRRPSFALMDLALFLMAGSALLIAAIGSQHFVPEPDSESVDIPRPAIEPRDQFFGAAVPASGILWAAGNHGKIVRSEDGGESWTIQPVPVDDNLQDLGAWDSERALAVGNGGVVLVTADGGATWQPVETPRSQIVNKLFRVVVRPGLEAWAVGAGGMIIVSRDAGVTWERRSAREDVAWNGIAFSAEGTALVVGEFGRILRSEDDGESWTEVESSVERSLMGVAFRDPGRAVAVGLDGLVLHSEDGGLSWRRARLETTTHLFDVLWQGERWIALGDGGLVLTGSEDGREWREHRLGDHELGWHTEGLATGDGVFLVGASQGIWNGEWRRFAG